MMTTRESKKRIPLSKIAPLIDRARETAIEYQRLTGKPLGIVGEVGEYEAARCLKLTLLDARTPRHDAVDRTGRRIEIKTRRTRDGKVNIGRIGSIGLTHPWDALVLVVLDNDFRPTVILEANRNAVEKALLKPGSKARNVRGQLHISKMKSIGRVIWEAP